MLLKLQGSSALDAAVRSVGVVAFFYELFLFFELMKGVEVQIVEDVIFEDVVESLGESIFVAGFGHTGTDFLGSQGGDKIGFDVLFTAVGMKDQFGKVGHFSFPKCLVEHLLGGKGGVHGLGETQAEEPSAVYIQQAGSIAQQESVGAVEVTDVAHP